MGFRKNRVLARVRHDDIIIFNHHFRRYFSWIIFISPSQLLSLLGGL